MARSLRRLLLVLVLAFAALPASAPAAEPPWCGTPEPDYSSDVLPDGTDPADPDGSFPHIPHYAIGCTLEDIRDRSRGRMKVEVIGESSEGREMYGVVINRLRTRAERRGYLNWLAIRSVALKSPSLAQKLARRAVDIKVPVLVQGSIHGNEFEGVDSVMEVIEKYATTPYGTDPKVDEILSNTILVFNVVQNPDGRVYGVRQNANGFDLNRDYLTQSQPETLHSIRWMQRWQAPEMLDLHGYTSPMLIEATTKPHNPSIEYDMWLKWNQPRTLFNLEAMKATGQDVQRPINDWCPESEPLPDGKCMNNVEPGPDVAEGWDDWGPFYAPMYHQHIGLDSSTVETCIDLEEDLPTGAWWRPCGGRLGGRDSHTVVQESTFEFVADHREEMLADMLEVYRRGDVDAPRPPCCPDPFDPEFHNWMHDYPQAYVIPFGKGQRSDAEANRLVEWLLFNEIEVDELERDYRLGSQTFEEGSYVVRMAQPRRGLADTALSLGVDISSRIQRLYAPPAAWSHGYLWGATTVTIPDGTRFSPRTDRVHRPNRLKGSLPGGKVKAYTLRIDSPTAVRTLNALVREGADVSLATEAFSGGPAGTAVFGTDRATRRALHDAARESGLDFGNVSGSLPALKPIDRVPRFVVLSAFGNPPGGSTLLNPRVDQSVWVLRNLGFDAVPTSAPELNDAPDNPLLRGHDIFFSSGVPPVDNRGRPINVVGRDRIQQYLAAGGDYMGVQELGVDQLTEGTTVRDVAAEDAAGAGRSGIVYWDNTGGANSVITGAMPARDTAIVDPPTWLTQTPAGWTADASLPQTDFFAAGMWPTELRLPAAGRPIIAHGEVGASRIVLFANNPLYRADPEREWPMVATAAYWADN